MDETGPLDTPDLRPDLLLPLLPDFEPPPLLEELLLEPFLFWIVNFMPSELGFTMYSDAFPLVRAAVKEGALVMELAWVKAALIAVVEETQFANVPDPVADSRLLPVLEGSFNVPPPLIDPKPLIFTPAPIPPVPAASEVLVVCWVMVISGSTSTASSSADCADFSLSITALRDPPNPVPPAEDGGLRFLAACSACNMELAVVSPVLESPNEPSEDPCTEPGPVRSIIGATGELEPESPIPEPVIDIVIEDPAARSSCFNFKPELFDLPPEPDPELPVLLDVSDEPALALVAEN